MTRDALDRYYTPDALASAICYRLRDEYGLNPVTILEPSSGQGAFVRAAYTAWPHAQVISVDLDPESTAEHAGVDVRDLPADLRVDLVLGNPPYSLAEEFVRRGLGWLTPVGAVAYLLSSVWQAGTVARKDWLLTDGRPTHSERIMPRPKFRERTGTASVEYDLVIWCPSEPSEVRYLPWDKPTRAKRGAK